MSAQMKCPSWGVVFFGVAMALSAAACSTSSTAPANAPEGHTLVRDGVAHKPGLSNPTANCTTCHGADLGGGSNGEPSCYSCHKQKW